MARGGLKSETQRRALAVRREPYWEKLQSRGHLGFRRIKGADGTWIARWREGGHYHHYALALGIVDPKLAYDQAAVAARAYFKECVAGVLTRHNVSEAADRYIANRRIKKTEANAMDALGRINRCIRPVLGSVPLDRLKKAEIEDWLNGMVDTADADANAVRCSKDSANRNLTTLRALLNLAHRDGLISSDAAWKGVQHFANVGAARKVFLNAEQRKRLLAHTSGAFHDLVHASLLTGARYGEFRNSVVSHFNKTQRTLYLNGKTGPRTIPLSDDAVALFTRLAKSKLPTAYLLTRDDGESWKHDDQLRPMHAAVRKAHLPQGTVLYTCRHTFISEALKGGVDIHMVAKLCGTSVHQIETNYGHFTKQDASAKLNQIAFA